MRRVFGLIILFFLAGCNSTKTPQQIHGHHIDRIENHLIAPDYAKAVPVEHASIADRLAYWKVPGVSIAIIENGNVVYSKGFGVANVETGAKVDEHTLFHGASLSKPVNATAAMKLVQEHRLELDTDINTQLTAWKLEKNKFTEARPITLRRLLSHTAGMSMPFMGKGWPTTKPIPTIVDILSGRPPATQPATRPVHVEEIPGRRFHYSGGAVTISQLMIEEATGKPYSTYITKNIFEPLGMSETTFDQTLSDEKLKHAAPGYKAGARVNGPENVYPAMAAAGIWTTAFEYCNLVIELRNAAMGKPAKILSQGAAETMMVPYVANEKNASGLAATVGMGLFLYGQANQPSHIFYHAGSHAGYSCYMVGQLETGHGAVVMTNGEDAFDLIAEIIQTIGTEYGWPDYHFIPPPRAKDKLTTRPTSQSTDNPVKIPAI